MQLQRLRDLPDPVAPELAAARDLLRATRPLAPSPERMQRVRQALRTRVPPPALTGSSLLVKAALLLLAAGLTAGLLFWRPRSQPPRFHSPAQQRVVPSAAIAPAVGANDQPAHPAAPLRTAPEVPLTPTAAKVHRRLRTVDQRAGLPAAPPLVATTVSPVAAVAPPEAASASDAPPVPAVEISDEVDPAEAALVLSATQVLRQRAAPARALALLGEYQSRFPQGALQEEALALNLECLVALSDAYAGSRAREYLKRYPRGRFRAFAAAAAARYPTDPRPKE